MENLFEMKDVTVTNVEFSSSEDERDVLLIEGIAFDNTINKNNAVIEYNEAVKSYKTLIGKPLRILTNSNNEPTGHGFNFTTGKFDDGVKNIGYIHDVDIEVQEDNGYRIPFKAVMWKSYFPEVANKIKEYFNLNKLCFSTEFGRNIDKIVEGVRYCKDVNFLGLTIVQNPAWTQCKSIMVAENLENEEGINMGDENKTISEESLQDKIIKLQEENIQLKNEKLLLEKNIESINEEKTALENSINEYKTKEIGRERLEKLKQFGDCKDNVDDLGKLSGTDWITKLEEALIESNKRKAQEKPEDKPSNDNPITGLFNDISKQDSKKSNSEVILEFLQGVDNEE